MFIDFFSIYLGHFWGFVLGKVFQIGLIIGVLFVILAYVLLLDRKIWAAVQLRKGPNVVGPFGLFQSFADFIKFAFKEIIIPTDAYVHIFFIAPIITFCLSLIAWAVIPVQKDFVISDLNIGILYIFGVSSLATFGIILGGWASNSKYAFLGSVRSVAQMISYEIPIGIVFASIIAISRSLNISEIVEAQGNGITSWNLFKWPLFFCTFPLMIIFFISLLAETARPPFDLIEAESELVSGFHVEYSSTLYLLFMIAEYMNIALMSCLLVILFLGGWHPPVQFFSFIPGFLWIIVKSLFVFFFVSLIKALVPRYRYDQLMSFNWKFCIPFSFFLYVIIVFFLYFSHA